MSYWHILAEAREALEEGRFRHAEQSHDRAHAVRAADRRRVFVSEKLPDGLRRLWHRAVRGAASEGPGRWDQAVAAFQHEFRTRSEASLQQAVRQLELGTREEPETSFELLHTALYLTVASELCTRRLTVAPLLVALFELLPLSGRLGDRDLITPDLDLDAATRLHLAALARDHLERLDAAERAGWARTVLGLLDAEWADWSPDAEDERRWLAASLADLHADDVPEILRRWEQVDDPAAAAARRHWSRLRRLEILGGCDRHQLPIPRHEAARRLAASVPAEGEEEVPRRCRSALAVLVHRRPQSDPPQGWVSASVDEEGGVQAVFWWGAEPRDVAVWHAGDEPDALREFLAAAGGRIVWQDPAPTAASLPGWPDETRGRALAPYLEAVLEPLLPAVGWTEDLARRLALARCGPWRDGWRSDLGHPRLKPPGQDGRFGADQAALEPALQAGLLWLAVLGRVNEADPALRAGLGELGRRGDAAASFLHACAVLGSPDKAAVDVAFEAWTLPLLWTRPDPLTTARGAEPESASHEDLAGQEVAVVTTGRPGAALTAWGVGPRRWRVVLDRIDRLGHLRRQAREAYGPVTVVPPRGEVHHLASALRLLEDLATGDSAPDLDLLAVCHWIRLVETHNGDLLDHRVWRPRDAGTCPLHDRYADLVADLPRRPVPAADQPDDGGWGEQYAQRVRRSGLVAGLVADLPEEAPVLDAVWGVFDGSDASWVFLDTAAVHWRLEARGADAAARQHAVLAPRGRRHLSILGGRGIFPEALAGWLDEMLAAYGRPYHLSLGDATPPRLRLAGRGPLPHACLDPVAPWSVPLALVREAGADTAVLLPGRGAGAAFWQAAAAGTFGTMRWQPVREPEEVGTARLVVPLLSSLAALTVPAKPAGETPAHWSQVDEERRRVRREVVRRAALECGALLAAPAAVVDVLDVRWWRLLAPPEQGPEEALAWAGVPEAEIIDLAATPPSPPATLESWLRERVPVPGLLADWSGPPLADARPVSGEGVRVHDGPAAVLWRDLAADLLRGWEAGHPVGRLLLVSEEAPPGASALAVHLAAAGATVPRPDDDATLAPLLWLRPGDLLPFLATESRPLAAGRALVLDLDGLLPVPEDQGARGALLLGWLGRGAVTRLDLVSGPLSEAWSRFLVARLGAQVPDSERETGGWRSLRRAAGARLALACPLCGHREAGAVDGAVCAGCSADLVLAGADPHEPEAIAERGRQLLAQADLGRETPLEIWDHPVALDRLRDEVRDAGGLVEPARPDRWQLADGRHWHLRAIVPGGRASGPALLLRVPADPSTLCPRGGADTASELILHYDRLALGAVVDRSFATAADRLLSLLADPSWRASAAPAAPVAPALRPLVSLWRIGWFAGLTPADVGRQLNLLQWAGVLAGDLHPVAPEPASTAPLIRLLVHVPVRDMELVLAGLAAELERALEPLLAGGAAGAWHEVAAPGRDPETDDRDGDHDGGRPPSRLDLVLALAAERSRPAGDRLGYRAPGGAWFSSRRRVTWYGDRARLAADLLREVDAFAEWIRESLDGASRVEAGFVAELAAEAAGPELAWRLLLGQELGFWTRGAPVIDGYRHLAELHRLRESPVLDPAGPAVALLRGLAAARDEWCRRLAATPPGGVVAPAVDPERTGAASVSGRSWWRREGKDPLSGAREAVRRHLAGVGPGRFVLAGPFGSGRTEALVSGLAATPSGRRAPIWCPDRATAVRLHLAARAVDRRWRPRVHVWNPDDPLPQRGAKAPGEEALLVVAELQRFPREIGYQLQEAGRDGRVLVTVDSVETQGAREDLFLTTPRRDEIRELRVQILQAQQPWRVTRPLLPEALTEARGRRRDRGTVVSRRAGTLDECASAVAASAGSGRLGELVTLTAPLAEDVGLLRRALADRGWAAVDRDALEDWLLPGVMELAAALADAHRRRHGTWPGAEGRTVSARPRSLLGEFLDAADADDWASWLRSLPAEVLEDAGEFLARLRRSPWHRVCCLRPLARERTARLAASAAGAGPGDMLDAELWQAWRRTLAPLCGRADLETGPPAVVLGAAAAPGGLPAESGVYVCFGPEPVAVHRQVLGRITDRALVLYQEHSPLPGEIESPHS